MSAMQEVATKKAKVNLGCRCAQARGVCFRPGGRQGNADRGSGRAGLYVEASAQFVDALSHSHEANSSATSRFVEAIEALFRYAGTVIGNFQKEVFCVEFQPNRCRRCT